VDEVLKGAGEANSIALDLPRPSGAGAPSRNPIPQDGDQVLAFLVEAGEGDRWRPIDAAGAIALGAGTEDLGPLIAAARWFGSLSADAETRAAELSTAIGDAQPAVRLTAIRSIGDEGLEPAAPALRDAAADTTTEPTTATYAAVALWLLGDRAAATAAFDDIVDRVGAEQFFTLWQVQRSLGEESATLYGPDPDGWEGSR
jgi:hypothetical protein